MPAARIRVNVVNKAGRKFLLLRARDNLTNEESVRSSGTTNRREAERAAALWEAELLHSRIATPGEIGWSGFVDQYRSESLDGLAPSTKTKALGALSALKRVCKPSRLSDITSISISKFRASRRKDGVAETTISSELGHLRAAFRWAKDVGLLREAPHFPRNRRAKSGGKAKPMKGRPITDAEFEKMLECVKEVVNDEREAGWKRYLRGLWVSGLRLEESLDLWWDRDDRLSVDLSHEFPMLRVSADAEKAKQDRFLPIAPEFAEFLLETPERERIGRVFSPPMYRSNAKGQVSMWRASEIISDIGKKAGIVVEQKGPKYASAHDLRRSFGTRWARRVMPQVLMELMRHESIETTMRYYVDLNAQETSRTLWDVVRRESGDKTGDTATAPSRIADENIKITEE